MQPYEGRRRRSGLSLQEIIKAAIQWRIGRESSVCRNVEVTRCTPLVYVNLGTSNTFVLVRGNGLKSFVVVRTRATATGG